MSLTPQQIAQALARGSYPAAQIPVAPPPFPPGGGTGLVLGGIQGGTLVPLAGPGIPTLQPIILPIHETPPSAILPFNFAPGTEAVQIQVASWPCRRIVFFAPSGNSLFISMGMQGIGYDSAKTYSIAPGSAGVVDINDVITIYWVAGNATDIITGWAESNL